MSKSHKHRIAHLEWRTRRPRGLRIIYAADPDEYDERETHDQIRARLHLKPEPYITDFVYYQLREGAPPRLKFPERWKHTLVKQDVVVEEAVKAEFVALDSRVEHGNDS